MEKIRFILVMSSLVILTQACTEYFDVELVGKSTEETFYSNINEMQSGLNAVYSVLRERDYQKTLSLIGDGLSDDFLYQYGLNSEFGIDGQYLQNFQITSDNEWVRKWYRINYKGIYRANQLLANIQNEINIRIDEDNYDNLSRWHHIYGQALFLRAYYYFNLVRTFGGVSIAPEVIDIEGEVLPRSTLEETYQYIERDLRTSCILMNNGYSFLFNNTQYNTGYGEANKYVGLSLLMKVLITESMNGDGSENWEEARNIGSILCNNYGDAGGALTFNEVLKLEEFYPDLTWDDWKTDFKFDQIYDPDLISRLAVENGGGVAVTFTDMSSCSRGLQNWAAIWRTGNQNLESNSEPVFVVPVLNIVGVNPDAYNYYNYSDPLYALSYGNAHSSTFCPTNDLFVFLAQSEGLDPRNYFGIYSHNMTPMGDRHPDFADNVYWGGLGSANFQMFVKFFLATSTESVVGTGSSPRNLMLLRYSDVLLMYAEALNETGDGVTAIDVINDLRANLRTIGITGAGFPYTVNYGPYVYVRDRIRKERRRELAGEKQRYFDLLRYKTAGETITMALNNEQATQVFNHDFTRGVNELLPIPQIEIELSHGVIEQNVGY